MKWTYARLQKVYDHILQLIFDSQTKTQSCVMCSIVALLTLLFVLIAEIASCESPLRIRAAPWSQNSSCPKALRLSKRVHKTYSRHTLIEPMSQIFEHTMWRPFIKKWIKFNWTYVGINGKDHPVTSYIPHFGLGTNFLGLLLYFQFWDPKWTYVFFIF